MILDTDTDITEQIKLTNELFETFIQQRRLRCDLVVRDWRFEFLAIHKEFPRNTPSEYYIWVTNLHNPDDVGEEFQSAIQKIHELLEDYNIIPLHV